MIIGDNKKIASVIVAKMHPQDDMEAKMDKDMPEQADDGSEGLEAAAQDILDAFKSDDAKALAMAMHDFYEMCSNMPDREDEEEPDHGSMFPSIELK